MQANQTAKPTPGPWEIRVSYSQGEPTGATIFNGAENIADCWNEANARLIAEAPALLDDLRLLVSRIMDDAGGADLLPVEEEWDPENYAAIMRARATIARAEGRGA